nr:MAG TPA: hypothetical protein [Bacteriophage sp.]
MHTKLRRVSSTLTTALSKTLINCTFIGNLILEIMRSHFV